MPTRPSINRRTLLKGIGVSLAVPFMESVSWAGEAKKTKPPVRLGFMYMPHGVILDQFWPATPETFLTAPPTCLESLRPVLNKCLMLKGISGVPIMPFGGAPHALELSTWLTAKLPDANHRNRIDIGISADQIAANYIGGFTSLPSLELATMPQTHKENQEGLNEGYYSHCSYRSSTQALPAEINPRAVMNRLFGKSDKPGSLGQSDPLDRGMLDLVIGGARNMRQKLAYDDQQKLDEYLDAFGPWNGASRRSNIAKKKRRWKKPALAPANVISPIRRRSKSRFPTATSAANTCR